MERRTVQRDGASREWKPLVVILTERPELFASGAVGHETIIASSIADAANAAADAGGDVVVVIDIGDELFAKRAIEQVHGAREDVSIIVLYEQDCPELPDDAIASPVCWSDLMRFDLREEIERVRTREQLSHLREFAEGDDVLPIMVHADPDPDAIASAFALRVLLRRRPDMCPIVTPALMTRPENRRMAELLNLQITEVSAEELSRFERLICVDSQPVALGTADVARLAVIDHHPAETGYSPEFCDIRSQYGACATIMTQYLRVDDARRIKQPLATALLHAIKTDTASLTRGITPDDVAAFAYLQQLADMELLHRIEQPSNSEQLVRCFGRALHEMAVDDGFAAAYLGEIVRDDAHVMADLADFCMSMDEVVWSAVGAEIDGELVVTLRHTETEPGAGALARLLTRGAGSGGGHATMARAAVPLENARAELDKNEGQPADRLLAWIRRSVESLQ